MLSFFLLPFNPRDWETVKSDLIIDPDWYRHLMQQKWSEAKIYVPPVNSTYLLRWEISQGEFELTGGIQRNQQVVSFIPNSKASLIAFVLWHREVIPERFQLFLTWEDTWESLEVKLDTNEQDLVAFLDQVN